MPADARQLVTKLLGQNLSKSKLVCDFTADRG